MKGGGRVEVEVEGKEEEEVGGKVMG